MIKNELISLSTCIHLLQQERGFAVLYIQDQQIENQKKLEQFFKDTNHSIGSLVPLLKQWKNSAKTLPEQRNLIIGILDYFKKLEDKRQAIMAYQVSPKQVHDYYTFNLLTPIVQLMNDLASQVNKVRSNVLSAFCFFQQWKEKVGLERLTLIQGFIKQSFDNENYQQRIEFLVNEQHQYKNSFMSLASNAQRNIYRTAYNKIINVDILEEIHDKISKGQFSEIITYQLSAQKWFDLISEKLDAMFTIEQAFIGELDSWHNTKSTDTLENLNIEQRLVYKLAIFHQMPNQDIKQIIDLGEIYQLPKNKLIVAEDHFPSHFHVVLMGWVKIFKQLPNKKKVVLHMLSYGETIMDNCIFSNTCLKASAQSETDVLLFSIPVSVVRSYISQNNQFMLNILSNMANKARTLDHELERHKTQTVDYRIGYFLLDLMNQKKWLSSTINLPYSKSIIASQLGMRREVFSRSLAGLSRIGFIVKNKNITLPDKYALCQYCDNMIAETCVNYGTPKCIKQRYIF